MNINHESWDNSETEYKKWLKKEESNSNTEVAIHKSLHIIFRNSLRSRVKDLIANYSSQIVWSNKSIFRDDEFRAKLIIREDSKTIEKEDRELDSEIHREIERKTIEQENHELLTGIINGDQYIFNRFFELELPKIVRLVKNNSGTTDDANDVFQEGLIVITEKFVQDQLDLTASLNTFFYSVCRNIWRNVLQKRKQHQKFIDENKNLFEEIDYILNDDRPKGFEKISRIIESLGKSCKELLERYYYFNESWEDIALEVGYSSAASARNQKYKCLERIRSRL